MNDSEWSSYERLVMSELNDLKEEVAALRKDLILVRIDLAVLNLKAGAWGAASALVVALGLYVARSAGVL